MVVVLGLKIRPRLGLGHMLLSASTLHAAHYASHSRWLTSLPRWCTHRLGAADDYSRRSNAELVASCLADLNVPHGWHHLTEDYIR